MKWYENEIKIDDRTILLEGVFDGSTVLIKADDKILYKKHFTAWQFEDVLAEDILRKFQGKVAKIEDQLDSLVKTGKL